MAHKLSYQKPRDREPADPPVFGRISLTAGIFTTVAVVLAFHGFQGRVMAWTASVLLPVGVGCGIVGLYRELKFEVAFIGLLINTALLGLVGIASLLVWLFHV